MRGSVPGLSTPYPLGGLLPAILQEDEFAMRWTAGCDDVIAPVVGVLDCIEAYVDPWLTPADFLSWLVGWVGAMVDETWTDERRRTAVADAVGLHRARGTAAGLRAQLELATGGTVELVESGGVSWSTTPSDALAGGAPQLAIHVTVADPAAVHLGALQSMVDAAKPAHLTHTIEVHADDRLS